MNRCVPDFDMDDDYLLPSLTRPRKSQVAGDEIMELLWQNGPVVMQSHRSAKKSEPSDNGGDDLIAADQATPSSIQNQTHHYHQQQQQQQQQHNLFMQEDEMASWLHYPLNDTSFVADFCSDLLYPSPCVNAAAATTSTVSAATATRTAPVVEELRRQPPPKPPMPMAPSRRFDNFGHFSRLNRPRVDESGPSNSSRPVNESAVVDSSGTPAVGPGSRVSETLQYDVSRGTVDGGASADGGGREMATCELTVNSSPGASSACAEPPPPQKSSTTRPPPPPPPPPEDRKRKGIEIEIEIEADADADADADDCHSEDVELESADTKKQTRGSTSTKRSRAAEVHNLSERRRRDRINEKMRALQELIPHCNKADKASMLDEAIEYLKSLQMQVQMMSVGCSVVPMMFPGVHQYMPHMGMGIGMAMGMNRAMLPFPNMLPGSALPTPAAGAHLGPRFPMPTFHMPHVPAPDPSRISPTIQSDPLLSSLALQSQNQARIPNFIDPYQQYYGLRHMQLPLQQNQTPSGTGKPSTSKVLENLEKPPSG